MLNGFLRRSQSRETAEIKAAYHEFLEWLDAGQVTAKTCKPGDVMPAFLLPNAEGRLIDSRDLLAQGPLAVTKPTEILKVPSTLQALSAGGWPHGSTRQHEGIASVVIQTTLCL